MSNGRTYIDDVLDSLPDKTIDKILGILTPESRADFLDVMDASDTLMNNGMFNLDDKADYIKKGFDVPSAEEQDAINLHNQNEQLAYDYDIQLQMHEASPEEFPAPRALP